MLKHQLHRGHVIIGVVILCETLGLGIILPLVPYYVLSFDVATFIVGFMFAIHTIMQIFSSPIWGKLSDVLGRKTILITCLGGNVIALLIFAFSNNILIALIARGFSGLMGGTIAVSMAYIIDITHINKHTQVMGLVGAAFAIGFFIGPLISTVLLEQTIINIGHEFTLPILFAAIISLMGIIVIVVFWPYHKPEKKLSHQATEQKPFYYVFSYLGYMDKKARTWWYVLFLINFIIGVLFVSLPFHMKHYFDYDASDMGVQFFILGGVAIFIQGYFLKYLLKYAKENILYIVGLIILVFGLALLPMMYHIYGEYVSLILIAIGISIAQPLSYSAFSQQLDKEYRGLSMGIMQMGSGLGRMSGTLTAGILYTYIYGIVFLIPILLLIIIHGILFLEREGRVFRLTLHGLNKNVVRKMNS